MEVKPPTPYSESWRGKYSLNSMSSGRTVGKSSKIDLPLNKTTLRYINISQSFELILII